MMRAVIDKTAYVMKIGRQKQIQRILPLKAKVRPEAVKQRVAEPGHAGGMVKINLVLMAQINSHRYELIGLVVFFCQLKTNQDIGQDSLGQRCFKQVYVVASDELEKMIGDNGVISKGIGGLRRNPVCLTDFLRGFIGELLGKGVSLLFTQGIKYLAGSKLRHYV